MGPLAQVSFDRIVRAIIPFIVPIFAVLVAITYIPSFTLALPHLMKALFG